MILNHQYSRVTRAHTHTHTHRMRSTWHNLCTCIQRDTRTLTRANTLTTKWRIKTTTLTPTTHTPLFRPNGRVPRSHRSNSHALVHSIAGRARKRVLRPSYVNARNQWKVIHMAEKSAIWIATIFYACPHRQKKSRPKSHRFERCQFLNQTHNARRQEERSARLAWWDIKNRYDFRSPFSHTSHRK